MHPEPDIRFMADHMVIKLGKYLRILGYDAAWDSALRTHELILKANSEGRVFVSRNRHLPHQYPTPARVVLLQSCDPVEQLREVTARFALDPQQFAL